MFVEIGVSVKKRSSVGGGEEKTSTEIPGGADPAKVEVIDRSFGSRTAGSPSGAGSVLDRVDRLLQAQ